jgi:hypothetical protein
MSRRRLIPLILVAAWCSFAPLATAGAQLEKVDGVKLVVHPAKRSLVPGELLDVRLEIRNESGESVPIRAGMTVQVGGITLDLAEGSGPFRRVRGPGWGGAEFDDTTDVDLPPGESQYSDAPVLYNDFRVTEGLPRAAADEIRSRELDTAYVFERPGRYLLRGTLHLGVGLEPIQSEPVEVEVRAPTGQDAKAWNAIKNCRACARFLQTGEAGGLADDERNTATAGVLERVATESPKSIYAAQIRQSLENHRERLRVQQRIRDEDRARDQDLR